MSFPIYPCSLQKAWFSKTLKTLYTIFLSFRLILYIMFFSCFPNFFFISENKRILKVKGSTKCYYIINVLLYESVGKANYQAIHSPLCLSAHRLSFIFMGKIRLNNNSMVLLCRQNDHELYKDSKRCRRFTKRKREIYFCNTGILFYL